MSAISDEPFVTFSFPSMSSLLVWLYLNCDRWIGNMLKDFLGAFRNCLHSLTSLQRYSDILESKCMLKKYKDDLSFKLILKENNLSFTITNL
jgi:hypothetical protein